MVFSVILWKSKFRNNSYSSAVYICVDLLVVLRSWMYRIPWLCSCFSTHRPYLSWKWYFSTCIISYCSFCIAVALWSRSCTPLSFLSCFSNCCFESVSFSWIASIISHSFVFWVFIRARCNSVCVYEKTLRSSHCCTWTSLKEFNCFCFIGLWADRDDLCLRFLAFEFYCYWLMGATNVTRYAVHCGARAYVLVDFCSN